MKKYLTRSISILIVLSLLMVMAVGCGKSNESENVASTTGTSTGAQDSTATGPAVEIKIPVYERGNQGQAPADNNYWTKWIAEKALKDINVKVTYVPIPRTTDLDKFNLLLAANEAPDVIFSYDNTVLNAFYGRGVLQEIPQDLITKYAPNFVKYVGADTMKNGLIQGKQYFLTAKRPLSYTPAGGIIRQDWLDKLGLKNPASSDDFITVLKTFKEKSSELGVKNMVPLALSLKTLRSQSANYGFRKEPVSEEDIALYSDVQLAALTWQPEKERLQWYNKMNDAGLISAEWVLDKDNKKAEADFMNGNSGVVYLTAPISADPPILQTVVKNSPTAKFSVLDAAYGVKPGGTITAREYFPFGMLSAINKTCKNPAAVLKFFDWMSKAENLDALQNGVEGKNYTLKDGVPVPVPGFTGAESLLNGTGKDIWCLVAEGKDTGDNVKNLKVETVQRAPAGFEYLWQQNYDQMAKQKRYTDFLFETPVASLSKNVTTLNNKWDEALAKLVLAKPADFESVYTAVCKDYLASGYQEILTEKKKLYDAQKAKK